MKKCATITEISLDDFLKLDLNGYCHRRHYYNEKGEEVGLNEIGEWVEDKYKNRHWVQYSNIVSRLVWDSVSLNDVVLDNVKFSEKENFKHKCICLAIHTEPTEEEIEEAYNQIKNDFPYSLWTKDEVRSKLLFEYSYLDKWLTREGNQTYLIRCDVEHLYSEKRKFCTHDDYFEIPKSQTKAVYLIRW